jgi:site-specific recombinase XerD
MWPASGGHSNALATSALTFCIRKKLIMAMNNYSLGSREMSKAGQFAMNAAADRGEIGRLTASDLGQRFSQFCQFAKGEGANKLEKVDAAIVIKYGQELAAKVEAGQLSASTAQNLVSAVNSVMYTATKGDWKSVSPTKDCQIQQRCAVRESTPPSLEREAYGKALDAVREAHGDRAAAVVEVCRELGLRSKEASLLNAKIALSEAKSRGSVTVADGTKGGQDRTFSISPQQLSVLERAASAQGADRSLMPKTENWKSWQEGGLRAIRETVKGSLGEGLHSLRSGFACEKYQEITGHNAPCAGGGATSAQDKDARMVITEILGHHRLDVMTEYVGGRP